ncbi:MAG: 16S rRNA processing protein RimM [Firmicutes bacterium]|nr:16S rRNA processing protein RimM [Bacillota bacterium]
MREYFQIGVITSPHGIRGSVRVFPMSENKKRFEEIQQVPYSQPDSDEIAGVYTITDVAYQKNVVLLTFAEITDRDGAEAVKGQKLWIHRDEAVPLEEGEYYLPDLMGLHAVSDAGEDLGVITDYMEPGSTVVFVIEKPGKPELLIPFAKDYVREIDLDAGTMTIHLIPGIRDEGPEAVR